MSNEQAQGVDQANTAVAQMDKVTQQIAANAEESASASEKLSAQAQAVKAIIGELVSLVGGGNAKGGQNDRPCDSTAEDALRRQEGPPEEGRARDAGRGLVGIGSTGCIGSRPEW